MKRQTLLTLLVILLYTSLNAQDKLPAFGEIDKADLQMSDCSFDPGAGAMVLFETGEAQCAYIENFKNQSELEYRVRIKILKAAEAGRANIKIRYYNKTKWAEIFNISGISYNLDEAGNIVETKLKKDAIFYRPIDREYSEVSFFLPDVKAGTVFEYQYKLIRKTFGYIPEWSFQKDMPVKYSAYNVILPQYFQYSVQTVARQKLEKIDAKFKGLWYIMRDLPGLNDEPASAPKQDFLQRVTFDISKIDAPGYTYTNTWPKLVERLLESEDFGGLLKKNISAGDDLTTALSNVTSLKEKIGIVYKYVQGNMEWNGDYAIYPDDVFSLKKAWDKRNGNTGDINFLLLFFLRNAGIDAKPLLVSTKNNGSVNIVIPSIEQFNCMMVYVKDGDQRYVMNAADQSNPYYLVPANVLYTNGLVVDKTAGGLVGLNSDIKYVYTAHFSAGIENDKISGEATLNGSGYARKLYLQRYKKTADREKIVANEALAIRIDSSSIVNEHKELLPLELNLQFSGNMPAGSDYFYLPCSMFTGIDKNSFIEDKRVMDIDFDYPRSYTITGTYILAENYTVSELPKNVRIIMADTSIILTRVMQTDDNIISSKFILEFKNSGYAAASYPYIKDFFKKIYALLAEKIVLKKK